MGKKTKLIVERRAPPIPVALSHYVLSQYGDLSAAGRSGEAEINDSLEPGFLSEPFLVGSHLQLEELWFLVVIEAKGGFASCPTP